MFISPPCALEDANKLSIVRLLVSGCIISGEALACLHRISISDRVSEGRQETRGERQADSMFEYS